MENRRSRTLSSAHRTPRASRQASFVCEPAELDLRAAARIGVAEAGVLVRLNLPLEMGSKLVIELTFHVAAPQ
jgi:hypothetical protein